MARPHTLRNHLSTSPEVEALYLAWMRRYAKNPHVSYKTAWLDGYRTAMKQKEAKSCEG
jgi:hypothetical protein